MDEYSLKFGSMNKERLMLIYIENHKNFRLSKILEMHVTAGLIANLNKDMLTNQKTTSGLSN